MPAAPIARIDIQLREIIPSFFENVRNDVAAIRRALANADMNTARTTSHGVKGAAAGFGFAELADMGAALERGARDNAPPQELASLIDAMTRYLDTVCVIYVDTGEF
ncbi:MAG: Hpt domain-containing protein [Desulfovibrionaceae bacterium]